MGGYLNILIIVIGLGLVSLIASVSKDVAIFTDIKYKVQGKSQLDVIYEIIEEKTLEELGDKLADWQELIVQASQDVGLTQEEKQEMREYLGVKEKLILTEEEYEQYELVYKVNRRLGVWDKDAMEKYEDDLENEDIVPVFPKYYRIDNMGAKVSMWNLAKQIVAQSEIYSDLTGLESEEYEYGIDISKTPTISYGQDYILDDFVEKDNLLNIPGLVDVSGDLDKNKNLYAMTAVQLYEGELKYYEYSLIEDKYEEEKTASIEISGEEWKDGIPLITTVYNENTNLLESYIVLYSPSKKIFNMYLYSMIGDEIELIDGMKDKALDIHKHNNKERNNLYKMLDLEEDALYGNDIKDIKLSSSFNQSMNIPHIIMGVNRKYLYDDGDKSTEDDKINSSSIINYYDYFPIISDEFELSQLNHKDENINTGDWDISSFWSDAMNVGILKQVTIEGYEIYSKDAIALLDDEFEDSEIIELPNLKLKEESNFKAGQEEIKIPQISEIALTSFSDKMSNLTKSILMINYQGVLCEFLGTEELDEWDEGYEIDEIVNGSIGSSSSRGDISRIQAVIKPKAEPFLLKDLDIEIEAFNQVDDIKTKGSSRYKAKIYNSGLEYTLIERKRN